MEREQIIKALEICANYKGCSDCKECPLHNDEYVQCEQNVLEGLALSLIKELIETIEPLRKRIQHLCVSEFIASFDEVDINTKAYKKDITEADCIFKEYQCLKADTVKKMQESIKNRLTETYGDLPHTNCFINAVDQITKEMLEETDNE